MFFLFALLVSLAGALATSPQGATTGLTTSLMSTSRSTTSSSPSTSASRSADLSNLLGKDNRPVVDHVADTEDTSNDSRKGNPYFRIAATALLGLTKCNPDGEWIKSMFDLSIPEGSVNQGNDTAQVVLLGKTGQGGWERWTKRLERDDLEKVSAYEFDRDPQMDGPNYDNPWWPWALIEGALEAGWNPLGIEYQMNDLLHILTGEEVTTLSGSDLDQNHLWESVFAKADITPILIKWENAWSVVMTQQVRNDERWLGWADPYGAHTIKKDANNDPDGRLTTFTKYDTFAPITEVLHLKDFSALTPKTS